MSQKYNILIADDDPDLVKVLKDRLEAEGFLVVVAYEGIRAVEMAHKKGPDLIILDLKMPAGTGQSVLKNLRSHADTDKIPVIILTALSTPDIEREVKKAGAQALIKKPYESTDLLDKIRSLLPH